MAPQLISRESLPHTDLGNFILFLEQKMKTKEGMFILHFLLTPSRVNNFDYSSRTAKHSWATINVKQRG